MNDLRIMMMSAVALSVATVGGLVSQSDRPDTPAIEAAAPARAGESPAQGSAPGRAARPDTADSRARGGRGSTGAGALDVATLDRWAQRARVQSQMQAEARPTRAERVEVAWARIEQQRDDLESRLEQLEEDLRVVASDVEGIDPGEVEAALEQLEAQIEPHEAALGRLAGLEQTLESGEVEPVEHWLDAAGGQDISADGDVTDEHPAKP